MGIMSTGFLLFVEQGVLNAQKVDLRRLQLAGDPVPLARRVLSISAAQNGTVAYAPISQSQLTWFDRSGKRLGTVGPSGSHAAPALSPDESQVAVSRDGDIWVLDLDRGTENRLASGSPTRELASLVAQRAGGSLRTWRRFVSETVERGR